MALRLQHLGKHCFAPILKQTPPNKFLSTLSRSFEHPVIFKHPDDQKFVAETRCPDSLKHQFLNVFSNVQNTRSTTSKQIAHLKRLFELGVQTNPEWKCFVTTLARIKHDPNCSAVFIRNQPFDAFNHNVINTFTQMLLSHLDLETCNIELLRGVDSRVTNFHTDKCLQTNTRLKDYFVIVCTKNESNIPFICLPWARVMEHIPNDQAEQLKASYQTFYLTDCYPLKFPFYRTNSQGVPHYFYDNATVLENPNISLEKELSATMRQAIDYGTNHHEISICPGPGESVFVNNFNTLHRRALTSVNGNSFPNYHDRIVYRIDAIDPSIEGFNIL